MSILRFTVLGIGVVNGIKMIKRGGKEYYKKTTVLLVAVITIVFFSCFVSAILNKTQFDRLTISGIIIYLFSYIFLLLSSISLGNQWNLKIIIAKKHRLVNNYLFKKVKHPYYYLSLIPEALSAVLICKAWIVLYTLFIPFILMIFVRIYQEEKVMKMHFSEY